MAQWSVGGGLNSAVRSHTVRKGECGLFIVLCDGPKIPSTSVHWFHDLNTSIPCPGEATCKHHHKQLLWKGYPPVLMYGAPMKFDVPTPTQLETIVRGFRFENWRRRVLELTQNVNDLCNVLKRGQAFILQRPDYARNSPLQYRLVNLPPVILPEAINFNSVAIMENCFNKHAVETNSEGVVE